MRAQAARGDVQPVPSLALPPSLSYVQLDLRPSQDHDQNSLDLGAFSRTPFVEVLAQLPEELRPDAPGLQEWLLAGLKTLRVCYKLHLSGPDVCEAAVIAGLAGFSCRTCDLRSFRSERCPADFVAQPITVLPKCERLSLRLAGAHQVAWAVLIASSFVHLRGMARDYDDDDDDDDDDQDYAEHVTILGYTGQLPHEPWVLVLDDLSMVSGLPAQGFVQETYGLSTYWVWRNRAAAGLRLSPSSLWT